MALLHVYICRDFSQLSPNVETAMSAVTALIEIHREANKTVSKVVKSFSNLSSAETAPFEASACAHISKALSVSLPIMESVTERIHAEVCEPLQFLEVDTMKLFKYILQDVQQRAVDCVKSRKKSEKHLKVHSATVKEWVSYRKTRHAMLIEKSLEFAENMAAEVSGQVSVSNRRLIFSKGVIYLLRNVLDHTFSDLFMNLHLCVSLWCVVVGTIDGTLDSHVN